MVSGMKLSTKSTYGLRAMVNIALSYDEGSIAIRDIAKREEISVSYLEQILNRLKRAGLVAGMRGAMGGYVLSRKPNRITVSDIVKALEGDISPVSCVMPEGMSAVGCKRSKGCVTRAVWARLARAIYGCLDSITLADLCDDARKVNGINHNKVRI